MLTVRPFTIYVEERLRLTHWCRTRLYSTSTNGQRRLPGMSAVVNPLPPACILLIIRFFKPPAVLDSNVDSRHCRTRHLQCITCTSGAVRRWFSYAWRRCMHASCMNHGIWLVTHHDLTRRASKVRVNLTKPKVLFLRYLSRVDSGLPSR